MKRIFTLVLYSLISVAPAFAIDNGSIAPDFSLIDPEGKTVQLSDYRGKIVVLEWFNKACPFVVKHYKTKNMQPLQERYTGQDVVWLTINSTNPSHSDFLSPEKVKEATQEWGIKSTALLTDADGKVGRMYDAKTTPHMFIIGKDGKLEYQGAIDSVPDVFSSPAGAKNYVSQALDELTTGKKVSVATTKPYGCSVKYAK